MHAALHDDRLLDLCRLDGELQAVADDIGDAVIDLRRLVIVGQDDRVFLFLQPVDVQDQRRIERPFDFGNAVLDALADALGHLGYGLGVFEIEILGENGAGVIERGHGIDRLHGVVPPEPWET